MSRPLVVRCTASHPASSDRRLGLLTSLSDSGLASGAVVAELHAGKERDDTGEVVLSLSDIRVRPDIPVPDAIRLWELGPGESQMIAHVLADPDHEAVLDDRAARRCTRALGLAYVGTLGLVLRARKHGFIPAARPVIEALQRQGIRLAPGLVAAALAEVGE